MTHEIIIEQGRCWLWRVGAPVNRFTEKEAEMLSVDPESADASERMDAIIDIGAASPLRYIRPSNVHDGATTFYDCTGDGYVMFVPFEAFVEEYVEWLRRHPELYETEDADGDGEGEKVTV